MPFSGSAPNKTFSRDTGVYTGATAWQQTEAASRGIRADDADTHDQDLAAAINTSLQKDGANKPTADIDWGAYGLKNLGYLGSATEVTVASSGTTDVLGAAALFVAVSGTTTITSLGSGASRVKLVRFTGALLLTHNATSLILPTGANITTAAGDTCTIISDASSNVRVVSYQRADGTALAATTNSNPQFTTIELGHASDTTLSRSASGVVAVEGVVIPSISSTNTLTNKRVTPRTSTVADAGGTLTIASDDVDHAQATALSQATTIASPSGTPTNGQKLMIRLKDNGTARALTWNAAFRALGITLPTTTTLSKTTYVGCIWNSADSKWDAVATVTEA